MRLVLALGVPALAALVGAAAALGATPTPGASYTVHDHATPGDNWHLEAKVAGSPSALSALVVHAERCGDFTPYARDVPIAADGSVAAGGPLDPTRPDAGTWTFEGLFTASHRLDGRFRFVTPTCDTGPMLFTAHSGSGHTHDEGRHNTWGTPIGQMPDLSLAEPRRLRQVRRLVRDTRRVARRRFPTYAAARRAGYVPSTPRLRPLLFHVRHSGYASDRHRLDARRVEALVYYRPSAGRPVLVAFMYRVPGGRQPRFGKPILGWHSHGRSDRGLTQMTHVWLTGDLRSAAANCLPVPQLEAAVPGFRLEPGTGNLGHESAPCPVEP